ncbi:MAG: hypothetical protein Q4A69_09170 [Moraxella sp.]|nr:hypothetical protein [Moraxella sp.]
MSDKLKLYIAVLDSVPSYMVPTLVAHAVLSAHLRFDKEQDNTLYRIWLEQSFAKVVVKVNQKEFDKICGLRCHLAYESTILDGKMCCAVVCPLSNVDTPNVLKFAKLWQAD